MSTGIVYKIVYNFENNIPLLNKRKQSKIANKLYSSCLANKALQRGCYIIYYIIDPIKNIYGEVIRQHCTNKCRFMGIPRDLQCMRSLSLPDD